MTSPGRGHRENSMETILTFDNRDLQSQWSVMWSTTHITDMENSAARSAERRVRGRRNLRIGSLALSALMTMHCLIPSTTLTGGFFVSLVFMVAAVVVLANPARHFEVYLGQWSISGPGRAFRIIPMMDGIGIAMCIIAIVRAINCCTTAAIAALYVSRSVADTKLPFTYCRDFDFKPYEPEMVDIKMLHFHKSRPIIEANIIGNESSIVGLKPRAWRNVSYIRYKERYKVGVCKETYPGKYPPVYSTPAYNFFYVEVVQYRSLNNSLGEFNIPLVVTLIIGWVILWSIMLLEKIKYSRLIWNNLRPWFIIIPCVWTLLLAGYAANNLSVAKSFRKTFKVGTKEIVANVADALETALYIHSLTVGTELIHGKALNHFASGHIDPDLNGENVWHSGVVLLLTGLHSGGAAMCALIDFFHFNATDTHNMKESTLWVIPMYSKCTSLGNYSHLVTTLVFSGLVFSYLTVAFVLLKTALHTIFEYRVQLVFSEQFVVASLMLSCMGLSLVYATNGGIALLDSVNALMTGIAMPLVLFFELISLMYVYRSHDFQSDLHLATEENTCASRVGIQWQVVPFLAMVGMIIKASVMSLAEMPSYYMYLALAPLAALVIAIPMRALHNAYTFLRPAPRPGN